MPRVICSPACRKIINVEAIEIAMRLLGVENPVKIRPTKGLKRGGCHSYFLGIHNITFTTAYSAKYSSEVLWHELTHAAQVDQLGVPEFNKRYRFQNRSVGYHGNRFEVQANDCKEWHEFLPLV